MTPRRRCAQCLTPSVEPDCPNCGAELWRPEPQPEPVGTVGRASPNLPDRSCRACGVTFATRCATHVYCVACGAQRERESVRAGKARWVERQRARRSHRPPRRISA